MSNLHFLILHSSGNVQLLSKQKIVPTLIIAPDGTTRYIVRYEMEGFYSNGGTDVRNALNMLSNNTCIDFVESRGQCQKVPRQKMGSRKLRNFLKREHYRRLIEHYKRLLKRQGIILGNNTNTFGNNTNTFRNNTNTVWNNTMANIICMKGPLVNAESKNSVHTGRLRRRYLSGHVLLPQFMAIGPMA